MHRTAFSPHQLQASQGLNRAFLCRSSDGVLQAVPIHSPGRAAFHEASGQQTGVPHIPLPFRTTAHQGEGLRSGCWPGTPPQTPLVATAPAPHKTSWLSCIARCTRALAAAAQQAGRKGFKSESSSTPMDCPLAQPTRPGASPISSKLHFPSPRRFCATVSSTSGCRHESHRGRH